MYIYIYIYVYIYICIALMGLNETQMGPRWRGGGGEVPGKWRGSGGRTPNLFIFMKFFWFCPSVSFFLGCIFRFFFIFLCFFVFFAFFGYYLIFFNICLVFVVIFQYLLIDSCHCECCQHDALYLHGFFPAYLFV